MEACVVDDEGETIQRLHLINEILNRKKKEMLWIQAFLFILCLKTTFFVNKYIHSCFKQQ